MTRKTLDTQLNAISTKIIQLGMLVEAALEQALQAIQHDDPVICNTLIESDSAIDELRSRVEHLAFQSLILQQPLAGRDLRFLSSAPLITADLERAGDNAAGIAKLLLRMAPLRGAGLSQVQIDPSGIVDETQKPALVDPVTETS